MAKQLQLRRGTTAEHSSFTGEVGELTIDTDKDTAVVHDNYQAGGFPLLREDLNNLANASIGAAKLSVGSANAYDILKVNTAGTAIVTGTQGGIVDVYSAFDNSVSTFTCTNAGTLVPGMQIVLTPKSASSKFFAIWQLSGEPDHATGIGLYRNGAEVSAYKPSSVWSNNYAHTHDNFDYDPDSNSTSEWHTGYTWDAPNTASQITYQVRVFSGAGGGNTRTHYHNRTRGSYVYSVSKFTIFEYNGATP